MWSSYLFSISHTGRVERTANGTKGGRDGYCLRPRTLRRTPHRTAPSRPIEPVLSFQGEVPIPLPHGVERERERGGSEALYLWPRLPAGLLCNGTPSFLPHTHTVPAISNHLLRKPLNSKRQPWILRKGGGGGGALFPFSHSNAAACTVQAEMSGRLKTLSTSPSADLLPVCTYLQPPVQNREREMSERQASKLRQQGTWSMKYMASGCKMGRRGETGAAWRKDTRAGRRHNTFHPLRTTPGNSLSLSEHSASNKHNTTQHVCLLDRCRFRNPLPPSSQPMNSSILRA